ncbi:MAG: heparinase II/III family protein, partial [Burkholderiales bacterium]|nr:heparinase II/III family protein [Opitutaceae bacterium]
ALALDHRLTGDPRSLARAREELLRLADLPEWRPSHFLDVGEAALAAGLGYDWLHDQLSADDRERIAQAIVRNALLPALETPEGAKSWVDGDFNWTQVCHTGVSVAALAIAEREPALARRVLERALKHFPKVAATYAPDGTYAEGPSYWSYGTSFHVIFIETLRSSFGSAFGLDRSPGFLETAEFDNQMVAPGGDDFNFSDYHVERLNEPIMLWFARERRDLGVARLELAALTRLVAQQTPSESKASPAPGPKLVLSRHLPLELLWWDPALPAATSPGPLHWTASGVLPVAVMRSAWDDPAATYLAIKGGTPDHSHAHMDVGSFVLEADGVRWALDLGTESYGKMRAAKLDLWNYTQDSNRWTTFRVGPEGHNILRFDDARQTVAGHAPIRALPDAPDGTVGDVVDLSSLYAGQVARVTRTVRLHPDRSVSIADEWTAADRAVTATAQWLTRATVSRTPTGLRLAEAGKILDLAINFPDPELLALIELQDVSVSRATQDSDNPGLTRIVIKIPTAAHATARLLITARAQSHASP